MPSAVPGRSVSLEEERIAPAELSMVHKLPKRIRACIRKSNWVDNYKKMLDKDPGCSSN